MPRVVAHLVNPDYQFAITGKEETALEAANDAVLVAAKKAA